MHKRTCVCMCVRACDNPSPSEELQKVMAMGRGGKRSHAKLDNGEHSLKLASKTLRYITPELTGGVLLHSQAIHHTTLT